MYTEVVSAQSLELGIIRMKLDILLAYWIVTTGYSRQFTLGNLG